MIIQQYKIVFGGTMGSGKSSAIKALSEIDVLSTEALNTDLESHEKCSPLSVSIMVRLL